MAKDIQVSVVMPVYNRENYVGAAIESILNQTYRDLELIIIDDSSTDRSIEIIEEYKEIDRRIRVYRQQRNSGIPTVRNQGLELSTGKYIAFMDSDDVSLPTRIEKQVTFLENHTDIGVCGSWVKIMGKKPFVVWKYPIMHSDIYAKMLFSSAIANPTVMMRTSALHQHDLQYDVNARFGLEDYDLWSRALPLIRFANIPEVLLQYRLHGSNTDDLYADKKRDGRALIYARMLSGLQIEYTQNDLAFHQKLGMYQYDSEYAFVQNAHRWFEKIHSANMRVELIPQTALEAELGRRWTQICSFSKERPYRIFLDILASPFPYKNSFGIMRTFRALILLVRKNLLFLISLLRKVL